MYTARDAMTASKRWSYSYFCSVPFVVLIAMNAILISYSAGRYKSRRAFNGLSAKTQVLGNGN